MTAQMNDKPKTKRPLNDGSGSSSGLLGTILVLLLLAFLMGFIAYWRRLMTARKAGAPSQPDEGRCLLRLRHRES